MTVERRSHSSVKRASERRRSSPDWILGSLNTLLREGGGYRAPRWQSVSV
ncbi:unnamed protein product [Ectocarpus sp. 8 AP-2014]